VVYLSVRPSASSYCSRRWHGDLVSVKVCDASLLLTNLVFALLFTVYYRTTFFWAPIAVFSLLFLLSRQKNEICQQTTCGLAAALACLVLGTGTLYYKVYEPPISSAFGLGYSMITPIREAEYIARYFSGEKLGNTYNIGAYLTWRLWPSNLVMIDARFFPFRSWFEDYADFVKHPEQSDFLTRYDANVWVVDMTVSRLNDWLRVSPDWRLAFFGNSAAVWVKASLPSPPKRLLGSRPELFHPWNNRALSRKGSFSLVWQPAMAGSRTWSLSAWYDCSASGCPMAEEQRFKGCALAISG